MLRLALHWQILLGMVVGTAVGLGLNWSVGEAERTVVRADLPQEQQKQKIWKGVLQASFLDTPNEMEITLSLEDGQRRVAIVDATGKAEGAVPTLGELKKADLQAYDLFQAYGRSTARWVGDGSKAFGDLFLRMLQMVAVPLIVTSLMTGVMGLGHAERLGKMFGRTLLYYVCTSMLAIVTGLVLVNLIRPGVRGDIALGAAKEPDVSGSLLETLYGQLQTLIPSNPFAALAEANFLSIIAFTLAFAIFATLIGGRTAQVLRDFFSAAFDVMMAMTMAIIRLAPLGVLLLMLYVSATQGAEVFRSLAWYMLTVFLALVFHAVVTLPLIMWFVARRNPWDYAKALSPALLTAFSSASSNGTLPLTLTCVEQRAGVSNRVSSFVLPLGATVNMDGTALYEAVAVLFIGQLYFQGDLSLTQQIVIALTALLASIGAAGIPHAGLVMMVIILQAVGLPIEMQGIIIGVDRVLDMCRTSVNVWSDSCGCAVIARFEGEDGPAPAEPLPESDKGGTAAAEEFQP